MKKVYLHPETRLFEISACALTCTSNFNLEDLSQDDSSLTWDDFEDF